MFKFSSLARGLAWILLIAIIFVTISPIGLRPHTLTTVNFDRGAAFAVVAMLFVLAYPGRWKRIGLFLITGAALFEIMQIVSPTRHAHLEDALMKSLGVVLGTSAGYALSHIVTLARSLPGLRSVPVRKD